MRIPRRLAFACWVLLLACWFPGFVACGEFGFVYVDAGEGSASGGHAAIRLGDEVFHFQHVPPGLLRISREDFKEFRHQYGYLENRTIQSHSIEVSDETFAWLRETFNRRLIIQDEQFAALEAMDADLWLLDALARRDSMGETPTLPVKALGYFRTETIPSSKRPAASKVLKEAILARDGGRFLAAKRRQTLERLLELNPPELTLPDIAEERFTPAGYSFARRYAGLLAGLAALDVLEKETPVLQDANIQTDIAEFRLAPAEVAALAAYRHGLIEELLLLLNSERHDFGYPLLVGMARLHALDLSIATGRLVVLDRYPKEPPKASDCDEPGSGMRAALFEQVRQAYVSAKSDLAGGEALDERRYGQIEEAANRFHEVRMGMAKAHPIRPQTLQSTPSRPAGDGLIALPWADGKGLRREVEARREAYLERLNSLYAYDLITRNCVTEIFRTINRAIATRLQEQGEDTGPERIRAESQRLLGGYVDETMNLIPFAANQTVWHTYRVHSSQQWPPYRDEYILQEYRHDAPWLVDLRESNVLTSAIYRWQGEDAAFLFFTQDAPWPRPVMGGFNLAVALGQTLAGLAALPWDAGENLKKSLKGVAVSVPELFFFNIRKGSFPGLPRLEPD